MRRVKRDRNWAIVTLSLLASVATLAGAIIGLIYAGNNSWLLGASIFLGLSSVSFAIAGLTGKAEDFFMALVAWLT